jgi:hypothetical protein
VSTAPDVDIRPILAAVRGRLRPDAATVPLLDAYLERLTPDRWTIEWRLPAWLAARFGLPGEIADALVESNVLGLLAVRLADDLADGEIESPAAAAVRALSDAALAAALQPYRELLPAESAFWPFLERTMADWQAGVDGPELLPRTAPIRIAAFACCELAARRDAWPAVEQTLDHAMAALVLYDHFFDWEADVAARRWNAFVASIAGDGATRGVPSVRARVVTAMLTQDVASAWFGRIAAEAAAAEDRAVELGLDPFAEWIRDWRAAASSQGADIAEHYRRVADRATRVMFPVGAAPTGGSIEGGHA